MSYLIVFIVAFLIGGAMNARSLGGGYQPRQYGKARVSRAPRPPGAPPEPPPPRYIMKGVQMPWDRRPTWLWNRPWTLDDLPDTRWARKIRQRLSAGQ